MTQTWTANSGSFAAPTVAYYDFNFLEPKVESKKMKAKEALAEVIALSNFQGDAKDYQGFIEYVKEDNRIAADHVAFVTKVLAAQDQIAAAVDAVDEASDSIVGFYR